MAHCHTPAPDAAAGDSIPGFLRVPVSADAVAASRLVDYLRLPAHSAQLGWQQASLRPAGKLQLGHLCRVSIEPASAFAQLGLVSVVEENLQATLQLDTQHAIVGKGLTHKRSSRPYLLLRFKPVAFFREVSLLERICQLIRMSSSLKPQRSRLA